MQIVPEPPGPDAGMPAAPGAPPCRCRRRTARSRGSGSPRRRPGPRSRGPRPGRSHPGEPGRRAHPGEGGRTAAGRLERWTPGMGRWSWIVPRTAPPCLTA